MSAATKDPIPSAADVYRDLERKFRRARNILRGGRGNITRELVPALDPRRAAQLRVLASRVQEIEKELEHQAALCEMDAAVCKAALEDPQGEQ